MLGRLAAEEGLRLELPGVGPAVRWQHRYGLRGSLCECMLLCLKKTHCVLQRGVQQLVSGNTATCT